MDLFSWSSLRLLGNRESQFCTHQDLEMSDSLHLLLFSVYQYLGEPIRYEAMDRSFSLIKTGLIKTSFPTTGICCVLRDPYREIARDTRIPR